jgi:hypothetical protein
MECVAVTDYISVDTRTPQLVDKRFCFFFATEMNAWIHDVSFRWLV